MTASSGGANTLLYAGKRVLVTGCASGIGRAVAQILTELGAEVHGFDRNPADFPLASFHAVDLGDPAAIDGAVATLDGQFSALFNCVGLGPTHSPVDIVRVNFLGIRHLTDRLLDRIGAAGAIVNVSSNGGAGWRDRLADHRAFVGTDSFATGVRWFEARQADVTNAYAYAKEALIVWTLERSATLIARGVRINCVSPGAVQTPMLDEIEAVVPTATIDAVAKPIGRRSSPEEQAWPVLMLGSELASYINGVDLAVDGGFAATNMLRS